MKTVILGIGNVLWADEGFGVRCLEALDRAYIFDQDVELVDGGTQGIYLIHHVEEADHLLIFDAVDYGLEPGEIKIVQDDDVPCFLGAKKVSLHQTGFQEVLAMAQLKNNYPQHITLIGVQPQQIEDYGGSLTPVVKAQIDSCIALAIRQLDDWNIRYQKREQADELSNTLIDALKLSDYEQNRPLPSEALRIGDERVLNNPHYQFHPSLSESENDASMSVPIDGRKLFEGK